jgi:DNA replication ATP-dependent helicase Dna2
MWLNTDDDAFSFLKKEVSGGKLKEIENLSSSSSLENPSEVSLIMECVLPSLLDSGLEPCQIGIITAYQSQLALIQDSLSLLQEERGQQGTPGDRIECSTVDQFQGKDKDCILVSLVRNNDYGAIGDLLKDWKRLNVLLTRSKKKLILVGSKETFRKSGSRLWLELLKLVGQAI